MSLSFSSLLATCFSFFALFPIVLPFNITEILNKNSDFSTFNDYLTQTQLAADINSRRTITVLAVDNGNVSPLSGESKDVIKRYLSVHVILDYYDEQKLQKLPKKTAKLTTLFQSSGQARGLQGFLNVTDVGSGNVAFGSAVSGSSLGANLVGSIASQPYNISVLQISSLIMPSDIADTNHTASSPPSPSASQTSPSPSPDAADAPKRSPRVSPPEIDDGPTASGPAADAPTTQSDSGAPAYSRIAGHVALSLTLLSMALSLA